MAALITNALNTLGLRQFYLPTKSPFQLNSKWFGPALRVFGILSELFQFVQHLSDTLSNWQEHVLLILQNSSTLWTISSIVEMRFIAIWSVPYRQFFCHLASDFSKQSGITVTCNFPPNNSSHILLFKSFFSMLFLLLPREVLGPPLHCPACRGKVWVLQEATWFPRNTVGDTTPWCHAALGTVINTLTWGLLLRDHPWNIVRDCLFSFVSVFSSNLRYRAPLLVTRGRARSPVLRPPDWFPRKPIQDRE